MKALSVSGFIVPAPCKFARDCRAKAATGKLALSYLSAQTRLLLWAIDYKQEFAEDVILFLTKNATHGLLWCAAQKN
jgi:hypothetical protein